MARPTTRSRAQDRLRAGSFTQTLPKKRKTAAPKSKKSSENDSSVNSEDLEAVDRKKASTSPVTQNEPPSDASSRLTFNFKSQQPETPDSKRESTEPKYTPPGVNDGFQIPGRPSAILSPAEGDSGISLASLKKEVSIPKEDGVNETSRVQVELTIPKDTVYDAGEVHEEKHVDNIVVPSATVLETQRTAFSRGATSELLPRLENDPDTPTDLSTSLNDVVTKSQMPDRIDTDDTATDPPHNVAVQNTPAFVELPHNLGIVTAPSGAASSAAPSIGIPTESQPQLVEKTAITDPVTEDTPLFDAFIPTIPAAQGAEAGTKRVKKFTYGLTPGRSPFPNFRAPSHKACHDVNELLSEAHGEVIAPKTIPEPSLTVTGCGEVPSVLDALIRTLLSGATTGSNSARAFNGLVQRFGTLTEGIGKGSVNWDAVREAPLRDVYKAIQCGGLADIKSKNLKALLDQVYEENQERKNRHTVEKSAAVDNEGTSNCSDKVKEAEEVREYDIASANDHYLNLQYIHKYKTPEAMRALIRYPGIGPKTAACVLLFCLQRPCFAVDTHIFRICKWLGWVPDNANEITAFSHLDVRIPDELKYSLHQLLIKHGKECPRCRAITSPTSADWDKGCPIEDLVKRTGKKKVGPARQYVQTGPAKRTLKRKTTVVLKDTKGKRDGAKAKTTKTKANTTRATKPPADKQTDTLPGPSAATLDQPEAIQPLVVSTQDTSQPNQLKRKRGDSAMKAPQEKKPDHPGKRPSRAGTPKAKSGMIQKKPAAGKPAKKEKPIPLAGTRKSSRLLVRS